MDNEKIILFMGRLVYEKGVQHLIAAMPKILRWIIMMQNLVIAGKGGMIDELKDASRLIWEYQNKVYFAGYLKCKQMYKKCTKQQI